MRISFSQFCSEVKRAIASLPKEFRERMDNVVIDVEEEPTPADWDHVEGGGPEDDDDTLLGLFIGVPLTEVSSGETPMNQIKIFRRPIEDLSRTEQELRRIIRDTVLHELAHHFGYSEEDLEAFEESRWPEEDGGTD